jgi:hypothetical protein
MRRKNTQLAKSTLQVTGDVNEQTIIILVLVKINVLN